MSKLSLVIPAYNEGLRIEEPLNRTLKYLSDKGGQFEIIISDDGSRDDTVHKVKSLIPLWPNLRIVEGTHAGKAAAVRSGVEAATGDYILMMDADGGVGIDQAEILISRLEESNADIAIGSREGRKAQRLDEPFYRHLLGRVFNLLIKILTGLNFEDTQCGFKLFKSGVFKDLSGRSRIMNHKNDRLKSPLVTAFDVELLVLARKFGYKTVEVPILWRHVKTENINPVKDSIRMLADVLATQLNLLTGKYDRGAK